jgi:hypothetical protein
MSITNNPCDITQFEFVNSGTNHVFKRSANRQGKMQKGEGYFSLKRYEDRMILTTKIDEGSTDAIPDGAHFIIGKISSNCFGLEKIPRKPKNQSLNWEVWPTANTIIMRRINE